MWQHQWVQSTTELNQIKTHLEKNRNLHHHNENRPHAVNPLTSYAEGGPPYLFQLR